MAGLVIVALHGASLCGMWTTETLPGAETGEQQQEKLDSTQKEDCKGQCVSLDCVGKYVSRYGTWQIIKKIAVTS